MSFAAFTPFEALAEKLLPHATEGTTDGSHDVSHLLRVWKNASAIHTAEGGDKEILAASTILHDCVAVEKNSPLRAQASKLAAKKASDLLTGIGWQTQKIAAAAHAIEAHSFSANIPPRTLEAQILQDADRLDAIGMVGAARCFYIAGRMGSGLYDPDDPTAENRSLDDKSFAIDHFETKLFKLTAGFNTAKGAQIAQARQERLRRFLDEFLDEI
ncbi:HD domain-containing protein [Phyllobacterium meliloti]|uniref:HD domain-containing protein n=1 Tax=Phyllobacterium meliloti TaxID=555317 RepID=UPI001D14D5CE|nr:HD domain-containing protein [Phyllobacterium sp. T1293]UGX87202.1 HD domain-containing protein [Phyllobacterium sp. T1293]